MGWDHYRLLFEGLNARIRKRRKSKENQIRQHLTDEIVLMERQARAEARTALAWYEALAAKIGLELRVRFCYTDEDFEESNSRPHTNYTYTVLVELSRPEETREDRIVATEADLLHVRLGRTAYRGVKDEEELISLRQELDEIFAEVRQKGFDTYLQEFAEG